MYAKKTLTVRGLKKRRIRSKISWTATRLRFSVFRSNNFLTAQLIDDAKWTTVWFAKTTRNKSWAIELWKLIASTTEVKEVVFDRNGFLYHWLIKLIADSARKNWLKF